MRKIILLVFVCLPLFSETPTRVQQTLIDASGNKESGQLTITWPNFVTPGSVIVSAGTMNVPIANGVLSVSLYPTIGATPTGVAYTVTVVVGTGPATSTSSEIWGVPASTTPVTRQSVILTQTPSINTSVMWSQMAQGGAGSEQVMAWNTTLSQWLPTTPENTANKGVANGYASLDSSVHVPIAQMNPDVMLKTFWLEAGLCIGTNAFSGLDAFGSNAPVPVCVTGTNVTKGALVFSGTASTVTYGMFTALTPSDFGGTIGFTIVWNTAGVSGNAKFFIGIACTAINGTTIDDPAFVDSTVVSAAPATTLQVSSSSMSGITACAANTLMHVRIKRDRTDVLDTLASDLNIVGILGVFSVN